MNLLKPDFILAIQQKIEEQLHSQRVGYLLGAGSSYLSGAGFPLMGSIWQEIENLIPGCAEKADIERLLVSGVPGLEQALDLIDDGGAQDTPHRHIVTDAIARLFNSRFPDLSLHVKFVRNVSTRGDPYVKIFTLNYDTLIEQASDIARIRLVDGFSGTVLPFFAPEVFEERLGRIRGTYKARQFEETVKPIQLLKLHGSIGWLETSSLGIRRSERALTLPQGARRLMIPPQRRKATETMLPPYSALWSAFRGCLSHDATPINRLLCIGYGFRDEHVNAVIDNALVRPDFTLLIFAKALGNPEWERWSQKKNVIIVTESRCSMKAVIGPGHPQMWDFSWFCREV